MLQKIRQLTTGMVATVIFIIIGVPFAFFGINYYFDPSGDIVAADVNGEKVTLRQLQRAYEGMRQRWRAVSDEPLKPEGETALQKQALEGLIDRELLRQAGSRLDMRVGNEVLRRRIQDIQEFQGEQGFDRARYEQALTAAGYTPAGFESQVREDLSVEQLQSGLLDSLFITEHEVGHLLKLQAQERDFRHATISSESLLEETPPSADEITKYYNESGSLFVEPEKVRIAYLELSLERIKSGVTVSEESVRAYFEQNRGNYSLEEQRQLSQLLIPLPKEAKPEHVAAAEQRAKEMLQQLKGGKTMKELAEGDPSEHPVEFTEFGYLTRGILEADVEQAAFGLAQGAYSEPVRSGFGLHLLQVTEIRTAQTDSFDDVRETVEQDFVHAEAQKEFFEQSDLLGTLAFENPDSLAVAASQLNLPVQESEFFTRAAPLPDFLGDPKIVEAAFSEEVLAGGNNSEPIELAGDRLVVFRVIDHKPSEKRSIEEVRARIVEEIKFESARAKARQIGEEIVAKLRAGANLDELATERAVQWQDAAAVTRQNPGINQSVLRLAFAAMRPEPGQAVVDGVALGSGDYAVVVLTAVRDPEQGPAAETLKNARKELLQAETGSAWRRFLADLKGESEVTILRDSP